MEILSSPRAASPAISPPVSRGPHCLSADLSSFPGTGSLRSDPWGGRNFLGVLRQPEPAGPLAHLGPAAGSSAAPAAADAAVPTSSSAGDTVHASLASAPPRTPAPPSSGPGPLLARPPPRPAGWPVAGPHLCSLVLEPDLDHTHAEARLRRQRLPDLPREGGTGQAWGWAGTGRWQVRGVGRGGAGTPRSLQESGKAAGVGVSAPAPPRPPLTFRQGLEETSKEALKALRCCVVRMVRGRLGLRGSFPSSPLPLLWLPCPLAGFMSPSSSSLFTVGDTMQRVSRILRNPLRAGVLSPPANTWHDSPGAFRVKTAPFPRPTGPASSHLSSPVHPLPHPAQCVPFLSKRSLRPYLSPLGRPEPKPPDLPC